MLASFGQHLQRHAFFAVRADNNNGAAEVLDLLIDHALLDLREDPESCTDQVFRILGGLAWLEDRQEFAFGTV